MVDSYDIASAVRWVQPPYTRRPEYFDLFKTPPEDLPANGAYVLLASRATAPFTYPLGRSPIYYIGQTGLDTSRLASHQLAAQVARDEYRESGYFALRRHPRYNYAARFGALVCWYPTTRSRSPARIEADLIDDFYLEFGDIPVANGQWPWMHRSPSR